jgi:hypothetical protein
MAHHGSPPIQITQYVLHYNLGQNGGTVQIQVAGNNTWQQLGPINSDTEFLCIATMLQNSPCRLNNGVLETHARAPGP